MKPNIKTGTLYGTGAAINVDCGFVPDYVRIINSTDGDLITEWFHGIPLGFDSGSTAPSRGEYVKGNTSGAMARVKQVVLDSGTFAGGDAAGVIVLDDETITGTFQNDEVLSIPAENGYNSVTDAMTANGTVGPTNVATAAAAATATGNAAISAYGGVAGATAAGFTVGLTISEDGKVLKYLAMRSE